MLTNYQKDHFDSFGFLVLKSVFSSEEIQSIREASLDVIRQEGGQKSLSGERYALMGFMERHPNLYGLVDDDRIHEIPETLLGSDFFLSSTDGHIRSGDTPWHGIDLETYAGTYSERPNVRVCLYFDELNKENGALRVIPGSHKRPFADSLQDLSKLENEPDYPLFGVKPQDMPCTVLDTKPGDVVIFTETVFHASFGGSARLQITAQFGASPVSDEEILHLRELHDEFNWSLHPTESYINSDRPRIRRMVSPLVEMGFSSLPV